MKVHLLLAGMLWLLAPVVSIAQVTRSPHVSDADSVRAEARTILQQALRAAETAYESERSKVPFVPPISETTLHTLDFAAQERAVRALEAADAPERSKREFMTPIVEAMLRARDFTGVARYLQYLPASNLSWDELHPRSESFHMNAYRSILDTSTWKDEGSSTRMYLAMGRAGDRAALRKTAEAVAAEPHARAKDLPQEQIRSLGLPKPLGRTLELRKISSVLADIGDIQGAARTASFILADHADAEMIRESALAHAAVARAKARAGDRVSARKTLDQIGLDALYADQLIAIAEVRAAIGAKAAAAQLFLKASGTSGDPALYGYEPSALMQKIHNVVMAQKKSGDPQGAIQTLHSFLSALPTSARPDSWYLLEVQYDVGDKEGYDKTIRQAREDLHGTYTLENLAGLQERIGDRTGALQTYRVRYNALLNGSESDVGGFMAAELQKKLGDKSGAFARLRAVTEHTLKTEGPWLDGTIHPDQGVRQAMLGDTEGARTTLDHIKDTRLRQELAFTLVRVMLQQGELTAAREVASDPKNHEPNESDWVNQTYFNALNNEIFEHKDLKNAQRIIETSSNERFKASAWSVLAAALLRAGDQVGALRAAHRGLQIISYRKVEMTAIWHREHRQCLFGIAGIMSSLKGATNVDRMLLRRLLREATEFRPPLLPGQKYSLSPELLYAQLSIGDVAGAIKAATAASSLGLYMPAITRAQAKSGDLTAALRLADTATDNYSKAQALTGAANGLLDRLPNEPRTRE